MDERAFPLDAEYHTLEPGMSLRDYFAAAAIPALVEREGVTHELDLKRIAKYAYDLADAMMKRRENSR